MQIKSGKMRGAHAVEFINSLEQLRESASFKKGTFTFFKRSSNKKKETSGRKFNSQQDRVLRVRME